jgi:hypothetical protein
MLRDSLVRRLSELQRMELSWLAGVICHIGHGNYCRRQNDAPLRTVAVKLLKHDEIRLGRDVEPFSRTILLCMGLFSRFCVWPLQSIRICCAGAYGELIQLQPIMLKL